MAEDNQNEQVEMVPVETTAEPAASTPEAATAVVPSEGASPMPSAESATAEAPGAGAPTEPVKPESIRPKGPKIPLPSSLQEIIGALLFASESPLTATELRTCVRGVAPEEGDDPEIMSVYQSCTSREIEQALRGLEKELERSSCGFRLVCAGGAYRLQTAPACGRYVRALLKLDRPNRLSRASLETLAIIAYRQPITKAEIEQIRGVAVDTIVKSLVELQLVRLVGRSELPGHPFLYGTSPLFLEHFGLSSLSELNDLDPTLQRSNPRERAKLFVKEKKPEEKPAEEPKEEVAAPSSAPAAADETMAEAAESGAVEGGETGSRRVSFRPDDEEFLDDTPDEVSDVDGDESLVDDDEPLVDDDEPLVDDDEDDDEDDADNEEEEGENDDENA